MLSIEILYARWRASTYPQVAILSIGLFVSYFIIVFTYRLTFHPLAKYPGPLFARISDWPLVIYCYRGDRHLWEYKNHQKYGPIVRYGANSLSISTASSVPLIHGPKANVKKGSWYKTLDISAGAPSVQMEIDKHRHALRRRFLAPAFSERALREAEKLITVSAVKLAAKVGAGSEKGWSEAKNLCDWSTYFGFDFISDLGYGESFGMLDSPESAWIPGVLKSASIFIYYVGYLPFIEFVRPLMGSAIQDYIGGQEAADSLKYTEMANSRLAARIKLEEELRAENKESERKDTFHYLLNSIDPVTGKRLTVEQLQADSALIIAAGSDGVAITLSACFFYLLHDPSTLSTLVNEIRTSFIDIEDIKTPKLNTLPYLHACLEETLRLNPPKPSTLPREVLKGGLQIDEHFYPPGVNVGTPVYVLHHDPGIFPEPWTFNPSRFIASPTVSAESVARAKAASLPFLVGPLNCIGKNMSYIALKLALVHVLFSHDVRLAEGVSGGGGRAGKLNACWGVGGTEEEGLRGREGEYQMWDWIIGFRDGPMVEVKKRAVEPM
ncbi:benzoate 4-monooxygenase cytochrome P450 [Amylocarpus encephaloides]|uniref:Benzoate 4-monooxygenase cytochrome P450 n=1 Tax=Amylocarpus encephaloides TaxID=45428 RepID=A0A9P7Y9U0_9HELO|nr:benzoate 4-monooxygenase cytochrome P450 [Amylocarpus encephaloides]